MYFKDIIGQQAVKKRLSDMVDEGRMPHALMLSGRPGRGKLALALALARYLCCTDRQSGDACGKCASCRKFDKLIHPDLHFVFPIFKPDSKKKWVCDDFLPQWREIASTKPYFSFNTWLDKIGAGNAQGMIYAEESSEILRKLSFKSIEAEFKVMLIWLPEKMHASCANKLLKILEEPPGNTVFLLISENSEKNLETIYSRAQHIQVPRITDADMTAALQQHKAMDTATLTSLVRLAAGSWLEALSLLESDEEDSYCLEQFMRSMRGAYTIAHFPSSKLPEKQKSLQDLKLWSEEMAKIGRERQKRYLSFAQRMIRENFILNTREEKLSYLNPKEKAFSSKFFPYINQGNVQAFMDLFALAERHIEQNVQARMVFFDMALQAILLFK